MGKRKPSKTLGRYCSSVALQIRYQVLSLTCLSMRWTKVPLTARRCCKPCFDSYFRKHFVKCYLLFTHRTTLASAATTAGTLCLELSSQPSDYSYFKSDLMATWAGPQHWKLRAKLSKGIINELQYYQVESGFLWVLEILEFHSLASPGKSLIISDFLAGPGNP